MPIIKSNYMPPVSRRVIDDLSIQRFLNLLSYENWEPVFSGQNINTMFNVFLDTFIKIFHTRFPEILRTNSKNYKPWLMQGIKKSCLNKKNSYQNLKYNKDSSSKLYFSTYCKILKSTIEISKKKYFDSLIHKSNNKTKMVWHLVKTTTNKNNSNNKITSLSINGNLIDDPVTITNSFNLFFSTVTQSAAFAPLDEDFLNNSLPNQIQDTLVHFQATTTNEINKVIKSLKSKNSYGYDEISTIILKNSAPYILSPLTFIFNKILTLGIFPDRMKYSIIKPLHKKGSNKELGNYRPISLLPVFSKVLEKLIYKRLYSFLENNRILSTNQYGFRKKLSTSSAIIYIPCIYNFEKPFIQHFAAEFETLYVIHHKCE